MSAIRQSIRKTWWVDLEKNLQNFDYGHKTAHTCAHTHAEKYAQGLFTRL